MLHARQGSKRRWRGDPQVLARVGEIAPRVSFGDVPTLIAVKLAERATAVALTPREPYLRSPLAHPRTALQPTEAVVPVRGYVPRARHTARSVHAQLSWLCWVGVVRHQELGGSFRRLIGA